MPEDKTEETMPGEDRELSYLPPELQYRNIINWLYTEDGAYSNKNEWRRKLLEVLEFNILKEH